MIVPGSKKAVLRGPFGNFEVLNGPVLQIFFRTGPKGPEVRWYTTTYLTPLPGIGYSGVRLVWL